MRMKRVLALCMAALMCASGAHAELKKGDRGGGVLRVQNELFARGYLEEEGDGQYGKMTAEAVKAFQQDNEIEPTGIVDDHTYNLLLNGEEAKSRKAKEKLVKLGYMGKKDEITAEVIEKFQQAHGMEISGELDEATLEAMASEDAVKVRPSLTYDSKGDAVKELQERLILFGFLNNGADGDFGNATANALKAYQKAKSLNPDGICGKQSWSALLL